MNEPSGKRILVVEDEPLVAMLLEDMLAELGLEILGPAMRLQTAMELARSERVDAAILDVNLGGERSYAVAKLLRERAVPYAFATGYGSPGMDEGGDRPVLQKPFERAALARVVADLLSAGGGSSGRKGLHPPPN